MVRHIKTSLFILILFCISCQSSKGLVSEAIKNKQEVSIRVEKYEGTLTGPLEFYTLQVKKNTDAYELHVTKKELLSIYKLPANKLTLLSEMETFFDDLHNNMLSSYYQVIVQYNTKKRAFKINTDIVADFIGGLKK
jgi:hypothetical protein